MYKNEEAREELKEARAKTKELMKMAEREISYMSDFYYHQRDKEDRNMFEARSQAVKVFNIFLKEAIDNYMECDKKRLSLSLIEELELK